MLASAVERRATLRAVCCCVLLPVVLTQILPQTATVVVISASLPLTASGLAASWAPIGPMRTMMALQICEQARGVSWLRRRLFEEQAACAPDGKSARRG